MTTKRRSISEMTDDDIRRARSRTLSYLRQEATRFHRRALDEARDALKRAQERNETVPQSPLAYLTLHKAEQITRPVIASFGVDAPMYLQLSAHPVPSAWTDYRVIRVQVPEQDFNDAASTPADVARRLSILKGLVYHEAGHILFSRSFGTLAGAAHKQGLRLPACFHGEGWGEEINFYAWVANVLEDQRMECALVRLSPIFENHLRLTAAYMILDPAARAAGSRIM